MSHTDPLTLYIAKVKHLGETYTAIGDCPASARIRLVTGLEQYKGGPIEQATRDNCLSAPVEPLTEGAFTRVTQ